MKNLSLTFLVTLVLSSSLYSQNGWYQQPSGTTNKLNCINSALYYPQYLWIAGDNGIILRSTNLGSNWVIQSSNTTHNLRSIYFVDQYTGFAVGDHGTILETQTGGQTWVALPSGVTSNLNSVYCYNDYFSGLLPWVVGDSGKILYCTDGGGTWLQSPSGTNNNLYSFLFRDSTYMIISGANGMILETHDAGFTWQQSHPGTSYGLNALNNGNDGFTIWTAGDNGYLYKSYNGSSWSAVNSGVTANLNSMDSHLFDYIAGNGGLLLKSTNSGINWIQQTLNTNNNLRSVIFIDDNTGWMVGDNGTIMHTSTDNYVLSMSYLNANAINSGFRNDGNINCSDDNLSAGFEWPKGQGHHARFKSGLWIGAEIGGDTIVSVSEYGSNFLPGYTDNNRVPHGSNDPVYRTYTLNYGVNDSNRSQWPNALLGNSDQGAPVYFDVSSGSWKPLDFGVQTMFRAYTDSYFYRHGSPGEYTPALNADVKELDYSFNSTTLFDNVIIDQFTIINKNLNTWNNAYLTIWTDDDLGDSRNDLTGCDTVLQMGYTYNGEGWDSAYGNAAPAVSFILLKGPSVYTGSNSDTDYVCNGKTKTIRTGYKRLGMKVFNNYQGMQDPYDYSAHFHYMTGYDRDGNPIINPITGLPSKFLYSGDPESNLGWVEQGPDDQRFLISVGPLTMNPGDSQTIVVAQVIARGTSNLNSVTVLKQNAAEVRNSYANCFSEIPIGIKNYSQTPLKFTLSQNYPNPFNPKTIINYQIAKSSDVKLVVYDILGREVITLVNSKQNAGMYHIEWDGSAYASGVYFYRITAGDFTEVMKMVLIK